MYLSLAIKTVVKERYLRSPSELDKFTHLHSKNKRVLERSSGVDSFDLFYILLDKSNNSITIHAATGFFYLQNDKADENTFV